MSEVIFRRAALDEQTKQKIREKVKTLLNQKKNDQGDEVSSGTSVDEKDRESPDRVMQGEPNSGSPESEEIENDGSGEIYLFDEEEQSREKVAVELYKKEVPKYKKEHKMEPGTKIEIIDDDQKKKPTDDGKKREKETQTPDQSGIPEVDKKGPTEQGQSPVEKGESSPEPAEVNDKGERQLVIKDKLIDKFGVEAKDWSVHTVDKSQLTEGVVVNFPDGSKKRYGDLNEQEKVRVHKALSEGLVAHKGLNDYTKVSIATFRKNVENNLNLYDDESIQEIKIDSDEPITKDNSREFAANINHNGRMLINKYRKALSTVSQPMLEGYVDQFTDSAQEGVRDGSLAGVSQKDIDEMFREDIKRMISQEVETRRRSLGDHGVRHLTGNINSSMEILSEIQKGGIPVTGKDKLMAASIMANHDLGYTVGGAAIDVRESGKHKENSLELAKQEQDRYEKVFGKEDAQKLTEIIGTHDSNEIDWEKDPVGSAVRLADNTSLFGKDKVQDLFIRSPKALKEACKLRLAAESGDADVQKSIKENLHAVIEEEDFDDYDKEAMHQQVDEMSEGKFSTTKDILSRFSGRLDGFAYQPEKKIVTVNMKYSPEGQLVDSMFGDEVAAKQFDKFAKDMGGEKITGKKGKSTFRNNDGKAVVQMNIQGFDKDPKQTASTSVMREFLDKTTRGELNKASEDLIHRRDASKAKKTLEKAKDKFSESEWKMIMEAMEEGSKGDLEVLAARLGAWPLIQSELDYLKGKTASLDKIAFRVALDSLGDKIAVEIIASRGQQTQRKDKDLMSDTGGISKGREREPSLKPPREENKKPWREKTKKPENRDTDRRAKTAGCHPLDAFEQGAFGLMIPQQNYYRQVCDCLVNVIMTSEGISEKAFGKVDDAIRRADAVVRDSGNASRILDCMAKKYRPQLCAESLYQSPRSPITASRGSRAKTELSKYPSNLFEAVIRS